MYKESQETTDLLSLGDDEISVKEKEVKKKKTKKEKKEKKKTKDKESRYMLFKT